MRTIRWRDIVLDDRAYHLGRAEFGPGRPRTRHTHDFPEVFWMERGQALHEVNGERHLLWAGQVAFMRAGDVHGLLAIDKTGFEFTNVAFQPDVLADVQKRYFIHIADTPWSGPQPRIHALSGEDLAWLSRWVEQAAYDDGSRFLIDLLLLHLLAAVRRLASPYQVASQPAWLQEAICKMGEPRHLAGGVPEFVALAGRGTEHVNRVVRKTLGQTTTDLVNALRLNYAARELRLTSRPIEQLAAECGFENLSYFYRRFKAKFGLPPFRFRQRERGLMG